MLRLVHVALLTAGFGGVAHAAPVTALDLVAGRVPLFARIAPDGGDILTVIVEPDAGRRGLTQAIWRLPSDGAAAQKLVEAAGNPRWSPDGSRLAFLAREAGVRQLSLCRLDGAERRRLTSLGGGVDDYAWSPDGRALAVIAADAPGAAPQLHVVDVATGASRALTRLADRVVVAPWDPENNLSWAPDGASIAFATKPTARFDDDYRSDLQLVSLSSGEVRRLTSRDGMDLRPAFSPDGRAIAFRTSFGKVDRYGNHGLAVVSPDGKTLRDVGASMELGFLDGPYWHEWLDASTILFAAPVQAAIQVFAMELETGRIRPLTSGDAAHVRPSVARRSRVLALLRTDAGSPWDVWRLPVGSPPARLTRLNPNLEEPAAVYERVHWMASDGLALEGLLSRPAGSAPAPLVVYLHGGPEGMVFHGHAPEIPIPAVETMLAPPQYYRARGWAVFYPNFRGSGGYGERLRRAALQDWSMGFADDVLSGVAALVARGVADGRLFLTGSWRSGSTKVLSLLGQTQRFRAAASFSAYPNVEELARGLDDFRLQHHALFGGSPEQAPEAWHAHSPIHRVPEVATPLLLVHDEGDFFVPARQAQDVHRILLEKGVPGQLILYRSRSLRDDAALIERLFDWFASFL
jgi:dipeptidyl aminopeptidase/acylaminoacyl peptidase